MLLRWPFLPGRPAYLRRRNLSRATGSMPQKREPVNTRPDLTGGAGCVTVPAVLEQAGWVVQYRCQRLSWESHGAAGREWTPRLVRSRTGPCP